MPVKFSAPEYLQESFSELVLESNHKIKIHSRLSVNKATSIGFEKKMK